MSVKETLYDYYERGKVAVTYVSQAVVAKVSSISREDITDGISKVTSAVKTVFQTVYSWAAPTPPAIVDISEDWEVIGGSSKTKQAKKRD